MGSRTLRPQEPFLPLWPPPALAPAPWVSLPAEWDGAGPPILGGKMAGEGTFLRRQSAVSTLRRLGLQGQPAANLYNQHSHKCSCAQGSPRLRQLSGLLLIVASFTFRCSNLDNKLCGHPTRDLVITCFRVMEGGRQP